jgi:hypothetical protein
MIGVSMSKKLKFFIGALRYYTKVNKTFYPTGFEAGLDQDDADKLDVLAQSLAVEIVGPSNARPLWVPANDFQGRRLAKAYTDRGLKAAA